MDGAAEPALSHLAEKAKAVRIDRVEVLRVLNQAPQHRWPCRFSPKRFLDFDDFSVSKRKAHATPELVPRTTMGAGKDGPTRTTGNRVRTNSMCKSSLEDVMQNFSKVFKDAGKVRIRRRRSPDVAGVFRVGGGGSRGWKGGGF